MAVLDDQGEMKVDIFRDILDEQECITRNKDCSEPVYTKTFVLCLACFLSVNGRCVDVDISATCTFLINNSRGYLKTVFLISYNNTYFITSWYSSTGGKYGPSNPINPRHNDNWNRR